MNKYVKLGLGVVALIVLIVGSSLLYNNLSKDYQANNLKPIGEQASSGSEETLPGEGDTGVSDETEPTPAPEQSNTNINPAPDFTVYNAAGEEVQLSDFVGKPVILNFWASWCGPCKSEMPLFQQMYDTYGGDITFMVVNLTDGYSETVETAQAYITGQGYTFPVYFDTDYDAAYTYSVTSIPTTYFIDAQGNLIAYAQGALSEEMFKQGLSMIGY